MQAAASPYSVIADARSWMATMEILDARMPSVTISDVPTPASPPNNNNNDTQKDDSDSSAAAAIVNVGSMLWSGFIVMACMVMQF